MRRVSAYFVVVLLLATAVSLACGPRPTAARGGHGVLVLAIDALRADHVSGLGYDRATTSDSAISGLALVQNVPSAVCCFARRRLTRFGRMVSSVVDFWIHRIRAPLAAQNLQRI